MKNSTSAPLLPNGMLSAAGRVLVACEYSGIVRDAFAAKGWDAWSCDILPAETEGNHYEGDVFDIINDGWDLMIAHPPCTFLTVAANRHIPGNPERWQKQTDALKFVYELMNAPIEHIAIENPIGVICTYIRKPEQIIQPYFFGDNIPKSTCLWLKNLPPLQYALEDNLFMRKTAVEPQYVIYNSAKNKSGKSKYSVMGRLGKGKGKERSKFFPSVAQAMAEQWTDYLMREERLFHEPQCCCQFNPSTDKIQDNVLGSNCCPVHNLKPDECYAETKCRCR